MLQNSSEILNYSCGVVKFVEGPELLRQTSLSTNGVVCWILADMKTLNNKCTVTNTIKYVD